MLAFGHPWKLPSTFMCHTNAAFQPPTKRIRQAREGRHASHNGNAVSLLPYDLLRDPDIEGQKDIVSVQRIKYISAI